MQMQGRDIGRILEKETGNRSRYVVESLRGFYLFTQTTHICNLPSPKMSTDSWPRQPRRTRP